MQQLLAPTLAASLVLAASQVGGGAVSVPNRVPAAYSQPGCDVRVAVNETNTPGDASNTYIISEPGSYYLPGDMLGESGKDGIRIQADNVTLDLMGFQMAGGPGSSHGIYADVQEGLLVRNGSVRGFGGSGVRLNATRGSGVEHIRATENGSTGIAMGPGCWIRSCTASLNAAIGIYNQEGVTEASIARENGGSGISVGSGGRAIGCTASDNAQHGFVVSAQASVQGCASKDNGGNGYRLYKDALATDCVASQNTIDGFDGNQSGVEVRECRAIDNEGYGFHVMGESLLRRNHARGNGTPGLGGGFRIEGLYSQIEDNVSIENVFVGYSTSSNGNLFKRNQAGDNGLDWSIAFGNACNVLVLDYAPAVFGVAGGEMSGSTDPNANYTF